MNTAFAAGEQVIPYPENLDTKTEGASSAPEEINHKDSKYFTENDFYNMTPTKDLTLLKNYPTYQQSTEYTCGPAAGLTVLYFYGKKNFDEMSLAKRMSAKPYPVETNTADMSKFFEGIDWHVENSLNRKPFGDFDEFKNFVTDTLEQHTPIMIENVEWGGHWRVIIGYDTLGTENTLDDVLIFADPYDTGDHNQDGYAIGNAHKFF